MPRSLLECQGAIAYLNPAFFARRKRNLTRMVSLTQESLHSVFRYEAEIGSSCNGFHDLSLNSLSHLSMTVAVIGVPYTHRNADEDILGTMSANCTITLSSHTVVALGRPNFLVT
ncbi:hypothetical protein TNCV_1316461 [Trichonephila clavipes]|nr:hypothetical protein TNCV_1316461 [Trichonephila clavipes]